jgi:hypothetical protein
VHYAEQLAEQEPEDGDCVPRNEQLDQLLGSCSIGGTGANGVSMCDLAERSTTWGELGASQCDVAARWPMGMVYAPPAPTQPQQQHAPPPPEYEAGPLPWRPLSPPPPPSLPLQQPHSDASFLDLNAGVDHHADGNCALSFQDERRALDS